MAGIKQKYQDLFFQTEQTVNRKKSGLRAAPRYPICDLGTFWFLYFLKIARTNDRPFIRVLKNSKADVKMFQCIKL